MASTLLVAFLAIASSLNLASAQRSGDNGAPLARVLPELITPIPPLRLKAWPSSSRPTIHPVHTIPAATHTSPVARLSPSPNTNWAPSRELVSHGPRQDLLPLAVTNQSDGHTSTKRHLIHNVRGNTKRRSVVGNFVPSTTSYRKALDARRRIHAASTQPRVKETQSLEELPWSVSTPTVPPSRPVTTSGRDTKVIVAPLEGNRKVYTAITYPDPSTPPRSASSERVEGEADTAIKGSAYREKSLHKGASGSSSSEEVTPEIGEKRVTTLGTPSALETKRQGKVTQVEELVTDADDMRRTTMGEFAIQSSSSPSPLATSPISSAPRAKPMDESEVKVTAVPEPTSKKTLSSLKLKAAELVKRIAMKRRENLIGAEETALGKLQVLVSRDTRPTVSSSSAAASSESVRFPAQPWQIPPALANARRQQNVVEHGESFQQLHRIQQRPSYETALGQYIRSQHAPSTALALHTTQAPTQIRDGSKALSIDARPLSRPVEQQVPRASLKGIFAKQHNHPATKPVPLPVTDESNPEMADMDLLVATTPAPGLYGLYPGAGLLPKQPAFNNPPGANSPPSFVPQFPLGNSQQLQYLIPPPPPPSGLIPAPGVLVLPPPPAPAAGSRPPAPPLSPSLPPPQLPSGGEQTYVAKLNPNAKLDLCCRKQQVSPVCQSMCNFDTFTDQSLLSAVLSNRCPGKQLAQAFDCATTKVDHTDCCRRAGVHLHNNGQCMTFCATHVPTPANLLSYVSCLQVFKHIKTCYKDHQLDHPNIYGD